MAILKKIRQDNLRITLWQKPNLPLIVGLLAYLMEKLVSPGGAASIFSLISYGALFTWGWLELFQGINYFRRGLGLVVLGWLLISRIN